MSSSYRDLIEAADTALGSGDADAAAASLRAAVEADPSRLETFHRLGRLLRATGRADDAAACYERCLEVHPSDRIAELGLAALGKRPAPARLPDDVVLHVFDEGAGDYDGAMAGLDYQVPELLYDLLDEHGDDLPEAPRVLDLGCGTGLGAELLRPFASEIVGVDLAPGMIEVARAKGLYDALHVAEVEQFLTAGEDTFDLILASNVLIYFGPLEGLLAAVAARLAPGGLLLFDVEQDDAAPHAFHAGGRFAHSESYLRDALSGASLALRALEPVTMRQEAGEPVPALVCLAARTAERP